MTKSASPKDIAVLNAWLERHRHVPNTYRTYHREFNRLFVWMLLEQCNYSNIKVAKLQRYLNEYASGALDTSADSESTTSPAQRAARTVQSTKSILVRMFTELVLKGVRSDNPALLISWGRSEARQAVDVDGLQGAADHWNTLRQRMLAREEPIKGQREGVWRTIAVAEWTYWSAIHRAELAAGLMSDIRVSSGGWRVQIRRSRPQHDLEAQMVHVPGPAVDAMKRYRISRGLHPTPSIEEVTVPLIAKIHSENPVCPWTIGKILRELQEFENEADALDNLTCNTSSRSLRRYLILDGFRSRAPHNDLIAHVRSNYAVSSLAIAPQLGSISESLTSIASSAKK